MYTHVHSVGDPYFQCQPCRLETRPHISATCSVSRDCNSGQTGHNRDTVQVCTWSVHLSQYFDLGLVECMDLEPADTES